MALVVDAGSPTFPIQPEEVRNFCANACGVDKTIIEGITGASPEQDYRMNHHIKTGSYVTQMVLHYDGKPDKDFLTKVLITMRSKNHMLRTRIVKYGLQVFLVVLQDRLFWEDGVGLREYCEENLSVHKRMTWGSPLFRYAFVQDEGETFFVITAHNCALDAWTLRLIFDDLEAGCSDIEAYTKAPWHISTPYGRYIKWFQSMNYRRSDNFWRGTHDSLDTIRKGFPILWSPGFNSVSNERHERLLHLPFLYDQTFTLRVMGHVAWMLSIASSSEEEDNSFLSLVPAREHSDQIGGIKSIMGPMSVLAPIRAQVNASLLLKDLMLGIDKQLQAMQGFEHHALTALTKKGYFVRPRLTQAIFHWAPLGCDLTSKKITCHGQKADIGPATLAYRADLSTPPLDDHGMLIEIYEHHDYVRIQTSWDHNVIHRDGVVQRVNEFADFLSDVVRSQPMPMGFERTVGDLLEAHKDRVFAATQPLSWSGSESEQPHPRRRRRQ